MKFIRKNGRVIPIRDDGEKSPRDYKKGYGATGALAAAGSVSYQAGAAYAQEGMKRALHAEMRAPHMRAPFFGGRGKLAASLAGVGVGMMVASKINAGYHILRTPKGKRMEETAKHGAAAAIGYKVGAWAGLPFLAKNTKHLAESLVSMVKKEPVDINVGALASHGFKKFRTAIGNANRMRLLKNQ